MNVIEYLQNVLGLDPVTNDSSKSNTKSSNSSNEVVNNNNEL